MVQWSFRSALPGVVWPAVLSARGAVETALLFQMEQSQWASANELQKHVFSQIDELARHAVSTVPFYRSRADRFVCGERAVSPAAFSRWPVLMRSELQQQFNAMKIGRAHV